MNRTFWGIFLLVVTVFTITSKSVQSEDHADRDVMLVLDNSGSMRKNDPQFLMKKVVSDFVLGLPDSTHAGIVIFDEKITLAVPLAPLVTEEARGIISSSLSKINYTGKFTDSPAGIERAIYELKSKGRKDAAKIIIFLTDGIVDTGDKARDLERAKWLREDLAAESQKLGIHIFGIAFTDQADFQLIQTIGERTGGSYFRSATADDIGNIFTEINTVLNRPQSQTREEPPRQPEVDQAAIPRDRLSDPDGNRMIWLIGLSSLVVIGVLVIVFRRGKGGASAGNVVQPVVPMPEAGLKDIREISGQHEYPITSPVFHIGRASTNQVVINKSTISTQHATIEYRNNAFYLIDQRSTNGTFLNGKKITEATRLKHADRIAFESYEFVFTVNDFLDEEKTQLVGASLPREPSSSPRQNESNYDPPTQVKDMCPNHPSWKATEVCTICRLAYCEKCIKESDGRKICVKCDSPAT